VTTSTAVRTTDVVFSFSWETYSDAVHRGMHRPPDRLLTHLLADQRVGKLLMANPYRSGPVRVARQLVGIRDRAFPATSEHTLYAPVRMRREDPTDVPTLARGYRRYDAKLAAVVTERGLTSPAVITAHPLAAGFCAFDWAGPITFYARDDWAELPSRRPYWPAIRAAYRALAESERAVVAVSEPILDRIGPRGPSAVVPNGVDVAEWSGERPAAPAWLQAIPGPRAIYVGTVDSRLDVEGIRVLAAARPELQVILLGHLTEPDYLRPVTGLPNIHLHGNVPRTELVAAIRNCDVALLAHRSNLLTQAMSPLKIYEYVAAGCPVLSVDLAPCRGISARVLLADSVFDFVDLLDRALALGPAPEQERLDFVHENSWVARHEQILRLALSSA
jgi:glycosyltransferase involved in cell wall biosynthesis